MKLGDIHKQNVAILKYFNMNYSKYDITDDILKDATKDLGGFYVEYDFILPNGRVLE